MPKVEEFQLHPWGWENDPKEERFPLSTLDYLSTQTFTNTAVLFKVEDSERPKVVKTLKEGLERTISQTRNFAGTIRKNHDGYHSIIKRKDSTFQFVVQYLDTPGDTFPSYDEIEKGHFLSAAVGDIDLISNAPMTCGPKPEAHPDNNPAVASVKANFITGGLILNMHTHHYSNGIVGFTAFVKQLAENCFAVTNKSQFPDYDPRCLERGLFGSLGFNRPATSEEAQVKAPPRPERNLQHKHSQFVTFHLPKSKAAELKQAASPTDGTWITTYNAVCALMWRVLSKLREPIYKPGLDYKPIWASGVSIAKLYNDPPMPARMQGNLQIDITSRMSDLPQLTLAEIISEAPLSKLALYTRQLTESVDADMVASVLQKVEKVRNKADLSIHLDAFPPMAILVSDWRSANYCTCDFGFAEPVAVRHFFGGVPLCQVVVYAPRKGPAGDDEGVEVQFTVESEILQQLVDDPEWSCYFEFRGVDTSEDEKPKL